MPTTSYGYELAPGDDAGHENIPVCCDTDMNGKKTAQGGIDFTCRRCGTVLEVDEDGLVYDIHQPATA